MNWSFFLKLSSLKIKLAVLALIPILAFIIFASFNIISTHNTLLRSEAEYEKMQLIQYTSQLIHELQKDRDNLSVKENLTAQSSLKEKIPQIKENYKKLYTNGERLNQILSIFENIDKNSSKESKNDAEINSALIKDLLWLLITSSEGLHKHSQVMRIYALEEAKENAEKFKLDGLQALSNKKISIEGLENIARWKSALELYISSPLLSSDKEHASKSNEIQNSANWKKTSSVFANLLKKSELESISPLEFRSAIEKNIEDINSQIKNEYETFEKASLDALSAAKKDRNTLYIALFILFASIFGVFIFILYSITVPIAKIITNLTKCSDEVSSTAEVVNQSSHQFSSSSTESAASIVEIVSSVDGILEKIKQNSQHANNAAKISEENKKIAESGNADIAVLVSSMEEITKGSNQIKEITNVIDDIAFQTNLLALNAAVEAARAGEQGRGFAVVAEAVRSLAGKCAAAAKDINKLIQESVNKIEAGTNLAHKSGDSLVAIVTSASEVAELNKNIATGSNEQATAVEQISRSMNQLDRTTQDNASNSEVLTGSADEMTTQAKSFRTALTELETMVIGPPDSSKAPVKTAAPKEVEKISTQSMDDFFNLNK